MDKKVQTRKFHLTFINVNLEVVSGKNFSKFFFFFNLSKTWLHEGQRRSYETKLAKAGPIWSFASPVRYVSIIQSNIESGPKMIQFNIYSIQNNFWNIHPIGKFIQKIVQNIQFKILLKKLEKSDSKCLLNINVIFEPSVRAYLGAQGPRVTLITM